MTAKDAFVEAIVQSAILRSLPFAPAILHGEQTPDGVSVELLKSTIRRRAGEQEIPLVTLKLQLKAAPQFALFVVETGLATV